MSESQSDSLPPNRTDRGVGKAILKYLPGQVLPTMVAFAAIPILTRMTDQTEYGMFVLVMTIVQTLNQSVFSWLPNCALRFYRPMKGNATYFCHLLNSYLFTVIVLLVLLLPAWPFLSEKYKLAFMWAGPILLCACGITILAFVLRAQSRALMYGLMMGLNTVMRYVPAIIAVAIYGPSLEALCGGWLLGYALNLVLIFAISGASSGLRLKRIDTAIIRQWLVYGGPLMLTGLVAAATKSTDRFLLDSIGGVEQLAVYGVCIQLGFVPMRFAATTVTLAVFPMAIDAYEDQQDVGELVRKGVHYLLLLCVPIAAIFGTLGGDILPLYATQEYAHGAGAIPYLLIAGMFLSVCYLYRMPFLVTKRTYVLIPISVIALVATVLLNLAFVPRWGVTGSAMALAGTNFLMLGLTLIQAAREVKSTPQWGSVAFIFTVGGVTVGVGLGLRTVLDMGHIGSILCVAFSQLLCYGILVCASPSHRHQLGQLMNKVTRRFTGGP